MKCGIWGEDVISIYVYVDGLFWGAINGEVDAVNPCLGKDEQRFVWSENQIPTSWFSQCDLSNESPRGIPNLEISPFDHRQIKDKAQWLQDSELELR